MKKEAERFSGANLFEGIVSLRVLIDNMTVSKNEPSHFNRRRILTVYYDRERAKKEEKEFAWLQHRSQDLSFDILLSDRVDIDAMAIGHTHAGILAVTDERPLLPAGKAKLSDSGVHVFFEGIEDPYNFGYALRSLYAAGIEGVWLPKRNWMSAAGVVCRASAGASERLPMYEFDADTALPLCKERGYRIVCADLRDAVSLYDADLSAPLLLVVGGEKRGITRAILERSDLNVRIDYARDFDAALSAASAATVIGFEIYRQNHL